MKTFTWLSCVGMGIALGFLGGILFQQKYLAPPAVVYHTPVVRAEPAAFQENCIEAARICYARKRSAAIK